MGDNGVQYAAQSGVSLNPKDALQGQQLVQNAQLQQIADQNAQIQSQPHWRTYGETGSRVPIRESRIKDRPNYHSANDGSIRVKIELDLEVEVDLYARVKGDVTIGLM